MASPGGGPHQPVGWLLQESRTSRRGGGVRTTEAFQVVDHQDPNAEPGFAINLAILSSLRNC